MRASEFTSKLNESMLITDVPNEEWLAEKLNTQKAEVVIVMVFHIWDQQLAL